MVPGLICCHHMILYGNPICDDQGCEVGEREEEGGRDCEGALMQEAVRLMGA